MTVGKHRIAMPDVADGELCYLSVDGKGRIILSPSSHTPAASSSPAWNGVTAQTDVIALLKAIHAELVQINANTAPTP